VFLLAADNNADTSFDTSAPFAMAGDEKTTATIPAVFLFHKEGAILKNSVSEQMQRGQEVEVLLSKTAKTLGKRLT